MVVLSRTIKDITSYVSSSKYSFDAEKPSISTFSLYKLFGLPTSIGGLIIKKNLTESYQPEYFGGGSVKGWIPTSDYVSFRNRFSNTVSLKKLLRNVSRFSKVGCL